ncbi:hypothetical protein A2U01_0080016, partial [Trifolium medium]|nr:hypothetical protein [Trifolium medium]
YRVSRLVSIGPPGQLCCTTCSRQPAQPAAPPPPDAVKILHVRIYYV